MFFSHIGCEVNFPEGTVPTEVVEQSSEVWTPWYVSILPLISMEWKTMNCKLWNKNCFVLGNWFRTPNMEPPGGFSGGRGGGVSGGRSVKIRIGGVSMATEAASLLGPGHVTEEVCPQRLRNHQVTTSSTSRSTSMERSRFRFGHMWIKHYSSTIFAGKILTLTFRPRPNTDCYFSQGHMKIILISVLTAQTR